jgi:diaminopimelate epimerase
LAGCCGSSLPAGCCKSSWGKIARQLCDRRFGIGADGLLVLDKAGATDVKMRIFNPDGSEAEMCGNGARCTALYIGKKRSRIKTKAGIIESEVKADKVKIKLSDPKDTLLDIPIKINGRPLKVNYINTGVPQAVIFVEGLDRIDVAGIGRPIRFHRRFAPRGTNVNFLEILNSDSVKIRTYERGVEEETLACGTGSVASALIFALKTGTNGRLKVHTTSREILTVYFRRCGNKFSDVWLEGKARMVYKGAYYYV